MNFDDRSIEYNKKVVKRPKPKKSNLVDRVNKFQEIVNQTGSPPSADQAE